MSLLCCLLSGLVILLLSFILLISYLGKGQPVLLFPVNLVLKFLVKLLGLFESFLICLVNSWLGCLIYFLLFLLLLLLGLHYHLERVILIIGLLRPLIQIGLLLLVLDFLLFLYLFFLVFSLLDHFTVLAGEFSLHSLRPFLSFLVGSLLYERFSLRLLEYSGYWYLL